MNYKSMRTAFLIFFAVLILLFAAVTWPFYKAAFLAFTLAVIFAPFYKLVSSKLRLPRYVAAIITTIIIAACVILPLTLVIGLVVTKTGNFLHGFAIELEKGTFSLTLNSMVDAVCRWIDSLIGATPSKEEIVSTVLSTVKVVMKKFYELSPRFLSTTISIVVNFLLMLVFLVVFLAEGKVLYNWLMETSPLSRAHWTELAHEVRITITTTIIAMFATAFVQGSLLGLGFWIAGFNQPYGWWLVAIILCIIPVIGAPLCYITASALLFFGGNTTGAIIFLMFGILIISTVDNLIKPIIVRGSSRMHPLLIFLALVGAARILGPIGLLVGPVLLSIFLASIRIYRREFRKAT